MIGSLEISQWAFPAERHASEPHPRAHTARQGRAQLNLPARGIGWFSVARRRDARAQLPIGLEPDQAPAARLAAWRSSVFAGEHHDHDPPRDGRIARVRRVIDEITVVVIDLEQHLDAVYG